MGAEAYMQPKFCPNPRCVHHRDDLTPGPLPPFWICFGSYPTLVAGQVPRFRCASCGKTFSERTFSIDYYTKRTLDNREAFRAISAGESVSSIARNLRCSVASVQNRLERLGRNAAALHAGLTGGLVLSEDLCADGFESFDRSQFFPNNINLLVGSSSQFLYAATHVSLRRKGRMTESQKRTRDRYDLTFRPARKSLQRSCERLFATIPALWDRSSRPFLALTTDEHRAYPAALARVAGLAAADGFFVHRQCPSDAPRTVTNPLFPVNYYDRELRKDIAAFRRESTCFTRNVAAGLLRFMNHLVWHNYCKPYRIVSTAEKPPVHTVVAGVDGRLIPPALDRMFRDRAFLSKVKLSDEWTDIWLKRHKTPLKEGAEYVPGYAQCGLQQGLGK